MNADSFARLRALCQRIVDFVAESERLNEKDYKAKCALIAAELRKTLARPVQPDCFFEVAAAALQAPGIEWGFVQQTAGLRDPEGGLFRDDFRVFIHNGSKHCAAERSELIEAVRAAFTELKVALPKSLA